MRLGKCLCGYGDHLVCSLNCIGLTREDGMGSCKAVIDIIDEIGESKIFVSCLLQKNRSPIFSLRHDVLPRHPRPAHC